MNILLDSLSSPLVQRIGWTLVHTLWQGVIIAAALAVVLRLLKHAPANLRYIASCCAMAIVVAAAVITFGVLRGDVRDPFMSPIGSETIDQTNALPARLPKAIPAQTPLTMPPPTAIEPARRDLKLIVLAWAIGVLAMSIWHIGGWLLLARVRRGRPVCAWEPTVAKLRDRLHIRRVVAIVETVRIDVPAVIGALRPVIVVPIGLFSGLSPQQVEAILAHELAHIRRHDYLVNLIQSAIETVLFYHPSTWWISGQIRRERENCCDDIAAAVCGSDRDYASALAALEERRGSLPIAIAATGGSLMERVRRVLHLPPTQAPRNRIHSLAAAALAIVLVAAPIACVTVPHTLHAGEKANAGVDIKATQTRPDSNGSTLSLAGGAISSSTQPSPIQPQDLEAKIEDYRTGAGDLLNVSITDLVGPGVETVKSTRVSDTGMISLPLVGELKVAGLTEHEIEKRIAKAYQDQKILANGQISVSVAEARQRTFNILGEIDRPGQYTMPRSDFRLLDALTLGGMHSSRLSSVHVIRAPQGEKPARTIDISGDSLAAGDASVNVVIHPGDSIVVASAPQKFVKIVIGKETLLYQGKALDWPDVHKMFDQMTEGERRVTVLEIAAASPTVTVERFFNVSAQLSDLVKQYHLAYLSQTGIQPTTEPAEGTRADVGEYYINGVKRAGVYSLTGRKISLKQALMAAGGTEVPSRIAKVSIVRRLGDDKETTVVKDVPVDDLTDGKVEDPYLKPNDMIVVKPESTVAVMEMGELIKQRDALASEMGLMQQKFGPNAPQLLQIQEQLKQLEGRITKLGGEGWLNDSTTQSTTAPTSVRSSAN